MADTTPIAPVLKPYQNLKYESKESLQAALGTKSVIFNAQGTHLYAMNLEGMSVYEYDRADRKLMKEFKFTPTKGMGWDY
ncbi:MAG TPA: YncE family protein, partial [Chitinophagaceae bacterium]|nr:YncE family protein [Chitinophagaceae bacterium]